MIGIIIKKALGFVIPMWLPYAIMAGGIAAASASATYKYLDWVYDFDQSRSIRDAIDRQKDILEARNKRVEKDARKIELLKQSLEELRLKGGTHDDAVAIPADDAWLLQKSK